VIASFRRREVFGDQPLYRGVEPFQTGLQLRDFCIFFFPQAAKNPTSGTAVAFESPPLLVALGAVASAKTPVPKVP